MYPTVTVEHLPSITTADDSDDMKIYEFDREATGDWTWIIGGCGNTSPGGRFQHREDVLAA